MFNKPQKLSRAGWRSGALFSGMIGEETAIGNSASWKDSVLFTDSIAPCHHHVCGELSCTVVCFFTRVTELSTLDKLPSTLLNCAFSQSRGLILCFTTTLALS